MQRVSVAGHRAAFQLTGADLKNQKGARVWLSGRQCLSSKPKALPSVWHYTPTYTKKIKTEYEKGVL